MKFQLSILTALILISCNKQASSKPGFEINGTITGDYSDYLYLNYPNPDGSDKQLKDSCLVQDGQFSFKGSVNYPVQGYIHARPSSGVAFLYLENSDIKLEMTYSSQGEGESIYRIVEIDTVNGSESYLLKSGYEAFYESQKDQPDFKQQMKLKRSETIQNNPKHSFSGKILANAMTFTDDYSFEEGLALFQQMDTSCQDRYDLKLIEDGLKRTDKYRPGNPISNISLPNKEDNIQSISDFKGQYTLVDFWASWCVPCRKKHPEYAELYKTYKDQLEIFSVSLDESREPWLQAMQSDQMEWTNVIDEKAFDGSTAKNYYLVAIPYSYLVDPNGLIVGTNMATAEIEAALNSR